MSDGEACVINIGPRERRKRLLIGVIGLLCGVALAAALIALGLSKWARLAVAAPFLGGATGIFQAREKT